MVRKLVLAVSLALGSLPLSVYAIGLGNIKAYSALNQNFKGEIQLLSVPRGELDTLRVKLASREAFARMGAEYSFALSQLKFKPVRARDGSAVIKVTSSNVIREPFLDFLVEVNWPNGRLVREYTVLLDPPATTRRRPAPISKAVTSSPSRTTQPAATPVTRTTPRKIETKPATYTPSVAPDEYGPVAANETLWVIAAGLKHQGVSIHQMMMALLKANPQAFINNNVNLLKKGSVLKVPDVGETQALKRQEAVAAFKQQTDDWMASTGEATSESADTGATLDTTDSVSQAEEASRLQIAAARPEGEGTAGAVENEAGTASEEDLRHELMIAKENVETSRQETEDLKAKVGDMETQVGDLKHLLELKDDQLAQMQSGAAAETDEAQTSTETAIEDTDVVVDEEPAQDEQAAEIVDESASDGGEQVAEIVDESSSETEAQSEDVAGESAASMDEQEPVVAAEEETISAGEPAEGMDSDTEETAATADAGTDEKTSGEETQVAETEPVAEEVAEPEPVVEEVADTQAVVEPVVATEAVADAEPESEPVALTGGKQASWLEDNLGMLGTVFGSLFGIGILIALFGGNREKKALAREAPAKSEKITLNIQESAEEVSPQPVVEQDTSFLSEYSTEDLQALQEDTADVDPVAEADVYIAYGRYEQAQRILTDAMATGDNSAATRYKMLEVYSATQRKQEFVALAEKMVQQKQDQEDPMAWERVQSMGKELDSANPLFGTVTDADKGDEESELTLDLSRLAEELDSTLNEDTEILDDLETLDMDLSAFSMGEDNKADGKPEQGTDDAVKGELDLESAIAETELYTEMGGMSELGDLMDDHTLDDELADLSSDLVDVMADSAILDQPLEIDEDTLNKLTGIEETAEEETKRDEEIRFTEPVDDIEIGGEVDTKLELAKAYMDMGDREGALSILREVQEDGTEGQIDSASELISRLNS